MTAPVGPGMWDRVLSTVLTLAALTIAGVLVHREYSAAPSSSGQQTPGFAADWRDALEVAHHVGDTTTPIRIVVFSDLECPYCSSFHTTLKKALLSYPDMVSYSFAHFSLGGHTFAMEAARAAECASASGGFATMVDFIFANQDSLGLRDWAWFAAEAGVADIAEWSACMAESATPRIIQQGLDQGAKMNVKGTPVVYLNGWRYPGAPAETEFLQAVADLVSGKKPYDSFPSKEVRQK